MFDEGKIYKHESAKDVGLLVLSKSLETDGVELKAHWVNVHYNEIGERDPFPVTEKPQRVFIHAKKLDQWKEYDPEANKGIRAEKA